MVTPRPSVGRSHWFPIIVLCAAAAGCSWLGTQKDADQAQAILPVPETKVRTAVIQVLQDGGYRVNGGEEGDHVLTTGYRQEIDSPSDWLLRRRFGTGRSRVDVTLAPEGETATRLTIQVIYEGKDGLLESWKPYPTPLPQSAENQLRLVKNALGLL
ncbi:MAG: hypothetical protein EPO61_02545 [Nitrospirae bacterium]|nr:MAG: hypothetical protein EPO61_02545 [Nitrospirota bacterium]